MPRSGSLPVSQGDDAASRRDRDVELVRSALAGDRSGLDEFTVRMACIPRFLVTLNARSTPRLDHQQLEDLVQDALATIWRRLGEFRGEAALETWVFRVCDFQFRNLRRREARRRAPSLSDLPEPGTEAGAQELAIEVDALHHALDQLPSVEADTVRRRHFDGLTFEAIGAQLGISPNTAKTRYYRGLETLRQRYRRDTNPS